MRLEENTNYTRNGDEEDRIGEMAPIHILPLKLIVLVWAVLVGLTLANLAASYVDLDGLNLWVTLGLPAVEVIIVAMYYMHLRYGNPVVGIVIITALVFIALLMSITMMDSTNYAPNLIPDYAPKIKP